MTSYKNLKKELSEESSYFIPGFSLIGLGLDLYFNTTPSGLLVGVGLGFIFMVIYGNLKRKNNNKS